VFIGAGAAAIVGAAGFGAFPRLPSPMASP
jgi:hypothetical protein